MDVAHVLPWRCGFVTTRHAPDPADPHQLIRCPCGLRGIDQRQDDVTDLGKGQVAHLHPKRLARPIRRSDKRVPAPGPVLRYDLDSRTGIYLELQGHR